MYVTFKLNAVVGIGTTKGVHLLHHETPICIEQETCAQAMALANTIGNNSKVIGVPDVTTDKPTGNDIIFMDRNGFVSSDTDHLVTSADVQSFIWAIKAGIQMTK